MDCVAKMNATLYTYFLDHPMSTQNAVVFLGAFVAKVSSTGNVFLCTSIASCAVRVLRRVVREITPLLSLQVNRTSGIPNDVGYW